MSLRPRSFINCDFVRPYLAEGASSLGRPINCELYAARVRTVSQSGEETVSIRHRARVYIWTRVRVGS
jgi:hypothetical protein